MTNQPAGNGTNEEQEEEEKPKNIVEHRLPGRHAPMTPFAAQVIESRQRHGMTPAGKIKQKPRVPLVGGATTVYCSLLHALL